MRRSTRGLLLLGIIAHLVCWLLPTYRFEMMGPTTLWGWEACWWSLVLPFDNHDLGNVVYALCALTNPVLWLALILRWRRGAGRRRWGLALFACAALDSIWFVKSLAGDDPTSVLLPGYYTWWASFALVGVALLAEAPKPAAAAEARAAA